MKTALNYLSIVAVSIAHGIVGVSAMWYGRTHAALFLDTEMELPVISQVILAYTASPLPVVIGIGMALASLLGLILAARSPKWCGLLPFLLTLSLVSALLHLATVSFASNLPLVKLIRSSGH